MKKISMLLCLTLIILNGCTSQKRAGETIIDQWTSVKPPLPPELETVNIETKTTSLLILDIQNTNCNTKRRPRCVCSIPKIKILLEKARAANVPVIYSLTRSADKADIREELKPLPGEPLVKSGPDKFFNTNLNQILKDRNIETVILIGTSAHGAVLNTAAGAAARGYQIIVPVDGISAGSEYPEQYTTWHVTNAPGTRGRTTLTKINLIKF